MKALLIILFLSGTHPQKIEVPYKDYTSCVAAAAVLGTARVLTYCEKVEAIEDRGGWV